MGKSDQATLRVRTLAVALALFSGEAWAGGPPYIGEIRWVAFDYAPQGWARCSGQLLSIAQYSALFSLLGTTYGGNGVTTFGLPDLRGRAPLHMGNGYQRGEMGGAETHTLTLAELPPHTHAIQVDGREATLAAPHPAAYLAKTSGGTSAYGASANTAMSAAAVSAVGSGLPHTNMKPFIAMNCIIALGGVYPSQN